MDEIYNLVINIININDKSSDDYYLLEKEINFKLYNFYKLTENEIDVIDKIRNS